MQTRFVTDHAVLRFAERVMGLDVVALRKHIAEQLPEATLLDGKYPISCGDIQSQAVVTNGVVVTVWKPE